ncbi:MAG TPA: hypothetical protein P5186_26140 [Candidatus Paceibacterota bacterium]|nr:hypothetical protein [Verrucomicrobiota bacterium]HRY51537.1 hypothetical protein [Candidatus Paceibacterota bacterium]HSA00914.1 hypothetical protein [Candidatus Paceibacterota bacterium]
MATVEWINGGGLLLDTVGILLTLIQLLLLRRQLKMDAQIKIMDSNREIVALGFDHPAMWLTMEEAEGTTPADGAITQRRYLQLWMNLMRKG